MSPSCFSQGKGGGVLPPSPLVMEVCSHMAPSPACSAPPPSPPAASAAVMKLRRLAPLLLALLALCLIARPAAAVGPDEPDQAYVTGTLLEGGRDSFGNLTAKLTLTYPTTSINLWTEVVGGVTGLTTLAKSIATIATVPWSGVYAASAGGQVAPIVPYVSLALANYSAAINGSQITATIVFSLNVTMMQANKAVAKVLQSVPSTGISSDPQPSITARWPWAIHAGQKDPQAEVSQSHDAVRLRVMGDHNSLKSAADTLHTDRMTKVMNQVTWLSAADKTAQEVIKVAAAKVSKS